MLKSAMIRARIEPKLKKEVESIFGILGLTATEAISLYYHQVKLSGGIPFELKIPNKITEKTFKKTDKNEGINKFASKEAFFKSLKL